MNHNDHTAKHGPAGRQAAKTPSDKQLEAMARGYCEALRLDPDELVQHRHEDAMTASERRDDIYMQLGLGPWATRESCRWKTLRADMERIWAVREALLAADMREVTPARPKPAPDRSYTAMSGQLFVVRGGERKTVGNCRVEQSCPDEAGADSFLDVAPDLCVSFKVTSDPDWGLWFARFRAPD